MIQVSSNLFDFVKFHQKTIKHIKNNQNDGLFFSSFIIQKNMFKKIFTKEPPPDWLEPYFDAKKDLPLRAKSLRELRFVVLDTETTGLNTKEDNLISIGAIVIENQSIIIQESLESILYSDTNIVNEAILIHGLRPSDLATGKKAKAALQEFYDFLNNSVVVAHHTGFDIAMLSKAVRMFYPDFKMYNYMLDTAKLAMKIDRVTPQTQFVDRKKYTLDALCERYDIDVVERHTAWGDAYTTAMLFLKLTNILEERGWDKLEDFVPRRFGFFN